MNILADEQLKLFEKGISKEEFEKRSNEFLDLYYRIRTYVRQQGFIYCSHSSQTLAVRLRKNMIQE